MEMVEALGTGGSSDDATVGGKVVATSAGGTEVSITTTKSQPPGDDTTWQEREYGRDTRILTALLHSNARAMDKRTLGTLWGSHDGDNRGYLCPNSVRLLVERQKPKYKDKSIPGMTGTETGLSTMVWGDEDMDVMGMSKRERREKFRFEQLEEGNTVDDIDEEFARIIGVDGEEYYGDEDDDLYDADGNLKEDEEDLATRLEYEKEAHLEDVPDMVRGFESEDTASALGDSGDVVLDTGDNGDVILNTVDDASTDGATFESTDVAEFQRMFAEFEKGTGPSNGDDPDGDEFALDEEEEAKKYGRGTEEAHGQ